MGIALVEGLDVWDALAESTRRAMLAAMQAAAQERAVADKDVYASNFSGGASPVELYAARREGGAVVLAYLFDSWEWCPAQSGSDWNYHAIYAGVATFAEARLVTSTIEQRVREYIHEAQEDAYDRQAAVQQVRAELTRGG